MAKFSPQCNAIGRLRHLVAGRRCDEADAVEPSETVRCLLAAGRSPRQLGLVKYAINTTVYALGTMLLGAVRYLPADPVDFYEHRWSVEEPHTISKELLGIESLRGRN